MNKESEEVAGGLYRYYPKSVGEALEERLW
jgi:hypothetical protein